MRFSTITATGSFIPENRVSDRDLEGRLNLPRHWIEQRTGIRQFPIADDTDAVSDLAIRAGKSALNEFQTMAAPAITTLILATSTPDHPLPPTAPQVAHLLDLGSVAAMDLAVACSGFLYALILANSLVATSTGSVLVIGANVLTRRCRPEDTATRSLFADGAGAVILSPRSGDSRIMATAWRSDGEYWSHLLIPDGGSRQPINPQTFESGGHYMRIQDGAIIFRNAVQTMADLGRQVVSEAGISMSQVDWWIPHQANRRIIDATRRLLAVDPEKTLTTLEQFGNSSAATIPITLDYFRRHHDYGCIQQGDVILLTAAAAGMTGAAVLLRI